MKHILFLCTGNSCRSQMAEGLARTLLDDNAYVIASAGLQAHGKNPVAVKVMAEIGIDITHQASTFLTSKMLDEADAVITLCGHADKNCPYVPGHIIRLHWPLEDPAKVKGTEEEIVMAFKKCRDHIKNLVADLPAILPVDRLE